LTGLANRREFARQAGELIAALDGGRRHGLCYVDLDQFKAVNDTLGHSTGDEMLAELARHMAGAVHGGDLLARLGGDEFGLLLRDCDVDTGLERLAALRAAIESYRFVRDGRSYSVRVSMGMVPFSRPGVEYQQLLSQADAACFTAKEDGRDRVHVASSDGAVSDSLDQMQWLPLIQDALDRRSIELYLQPLARLRNGGGPVVEILSRLIGDDGEPVAAGVFIPVAERFGLMRRLDRLVIERALEWLGRRPARDPALCFINISGDTIDDDDFQDFLKDRITASGIHPSRLGFELTETAAVRNHDSAQRLIRWLRERGCSVALDDFGTGLSSFGYLQSLSANYVKVDGRFIRGLASNPIDQAISQAITELGRRTGMYTVAEQVEDSETAEAVVRLGFDFAQGYFYGRPQPAP
jgi:Amt family ammonium transporter